MTDDGTDEIVVEGYPDLASDRKLRGREPDVVARELQRRADADDTLVAWAPEWLVDEKDLDPVDKSHHVLSGVVDVETEKAFLVAAGDDEAWLPKSVIRVYRRADGAEIRLPQAGLSEFSTTGGGDA